MRFLGIETLICTEEEGLFFLNHLPPQNGPFRLISEQNLLRLHGMVLAYYMPNFGRQFPSKTSNISPSFSPINSQITPWPFQGRVDRTQSDLYSSAKSCSNDGSGPFTKTDDVQIDGEHLVNLSVEGGNSRSDREKNHLVEPHSTDVPHESSVSSASCLEKRKVATLSNDEMSPELLFRT